MTMNHLVSDTISLLDNEGHSANSLVQVDLDAIHHGEYLSLATDGVEDVRVSGVSHTPATLAQACIEGVPVQAGVPATAANGSTFVLLDLAPDGEAQKLNTVLLTSEDGESMWEIHLDKLNSELQTGEGLVLLSEPPGPAGQSVEISGEMMSGEMEACAFLSANTEAVAVPGGGGAETFQLQPISLQPQQQTVIFQPNQAAPTFKLLPCADLLSVQPAAPAPTASDMASESSRRMQTLVDNLLVKVEKPSEEDTRNLIPQNQARLLLDGRRLATELVVKPDSLPQPPFRCPHCAWTENRSLRKFKRHLATHEAEKRHKCEACAASFNQEINLVVHKASEHNFRMVGEHSSARHVCPVCQKEFSRASSYKGHLSAHCIDEDVNCTVCGASYPDREALSIHMEEHLHLPPPTPQPVRCNQCGLRLPSLGSIRRHYTAAHPHLAKRRGFVELQAMGGGEAATDGGSEAASGESGGGGRRSRSSKQKAANLLSKVTRGQLIVVGGESEKAETVSIDVKKRRGRRAASGTSGGEGGGGRLALLAETLANTPSLKCVYCNKQFQKRSLLRRHLVVHTKERPHVCQTCGRGFSQAASLKIHEALHLKARPYPCEVCGEQFAQKGNRNNHVARMHGGQTTKTMKTSPDSPLKAYQCPHCDLLSEKESDIRVHMVEEHQMLPASPPPPDASTSFVKQLEDTLMDAGQLVTIQEALPGVDLDEEQNGAVVLVAQSGPTFFPGDAGVHELVDRATGRRIAHLVKKSADGKRRLFVCQLCLREFKKSVDLVRHSRLHTQDRPFQCIQCRKRFRLKSVLQAHLRTHQGSKAFQCHFCHKRFTMAQSMRVHMRLHTGLQPYACHLCPQRFATSSHRRYHVRTHPDRDFRQLTRSALPAPDRKALTPLRVDSQLGRLLDDEEDKAARRPHHCPYCPAAYKMENHLRAHVRQRHLGQSRAVVCQQCGKSFASAHTLRQHVSARHLHLRPHQCQVCHAAFTTKSSLARHMQAHTSERPFVCRICRRTFKTADTCRRHMRTHAQEHLAVSAAEPPQPPVSAATAFEPAGENLDQVLHSLINAPGEEVRPNVAQPAQVRPPVATELVSAAPTTYVLQSSTGAPVEEAQCLFPVSGAPTTYAYVTSDDQAVQFGPESLLNVLEAHIICDGTAQPQTVQPGVQPPPAQAPPPPNTQPETIIRVESDATNFLTSNQLAYNQCVILTAPADAPAPQPTTQNGPGPAEGAGTFALLSEELEGALLRPGDPEAGGETKPRREGEEGAGLADPDYYGCSECPISYNNSAQLTAHVRQEHAVPKQHRCNYCLKFFSSWLVLSVHLRAHTGQAADGNGVEMDSMMELCGDEYTQSAVQGKAGGVATNGENRCPACQTDFPSQASLSRHVTSAHERTVLPYLCRHCGAVFRTIRELRAHVMELLEDRQTVKVSMKAAKKKFSQRMTYAKAMQHRLRLDDAQTNQIAELQPNSHMTVSEKYLIEVAKEKHVLSLPGDNPRNSAEKTTNRGGRSRGDSFLTSRLSRPTLRPYICSVCGRGFRRPSDLQRHSLTHTGEKPFSCPKCARAFSSKDALKTHQRRHAPECKLYLCHVCGVPCSTKASLKVHMRLHTGSMPYGCPECGQRFRTPCQRISHFAVVHKQPYPATRKKAVEAGPGKEDAMGSGGTEMAVVTDEQGAVLEYRPVSVETQVVPDDIDALRVESIGGVAETMTVKKTSQATQVHERPMVSCVSTDPQTPRSPLMGAFITRGWRCTQCGRDFLDNCMYQTHACISSTQTTGISTGIVDKSRPDDPSQESKVGVSGRRDNTCDQCNKAFSRPALLQRHRRIHTGERPFACPLCERAFNQECALRVHLLKHSAERPYRCPVCNAGFSQRGNMMSHMNRLHAEHKEGLGGAPVDDCLAE